MKLNYNPLGHYIEAEPISVPASPPFLVRPEHDNIVHGSVEIWQNSDKTGARLTEETFDGSPSPGCFQVDYAGELDFRRSTILFNEEQAGSTWYIWYRSLGDCVEADDINQKIDKVPTAVPGHIPVFDEHGGIQDSGCGLQSLGDGSSLCYYFICKGVL